MHYLYNENFMLIRYANSNCLKSYLEHPYCKSRSKAYYIGFLKWGIYINLVEIQSLHQCIFSKIPLESMVYIEVCNI